MRRQEISLRNKFGNKPGFWVVVEGFGGVELFQIALSHDRNPITHRQGFFLIVRHKNRRGLTRL